jgi:hypothetical protein
MAIVQRLYDDGWADPAPDMFRGKARRMLFFPEGKPWDLTVESELLLKYPGPLAGCGKTMSW